MSAPQGPPSIWVRAVADARFREALVADPLRALAAFPDVTVSADQVRQLDGMDRAERERLVAEVLRRAHVEGGQARFGGIGADGRLGGPGSSGGVAPA
jgi:hypothetical protein